MKPQPRSGMKWSDGNKRASSSKEYSSGNVESYSPIPALQTMVNSQIKEY